MYLGAELVALLLSTAATSALSGLVFAYLVWGLSSLPGLLVKDPDKKAIDFRRLYLASFIGQLVYIGGRLPDLVLRGEQGFNSWIVVGPLGDMFNVLLWLGAVFTFYKMGRCLRRLRIAATLLFGVFIYFAYGLVFKIVAATLMFSQW